MDHDFNEQIEKIKTFYEERLANHKASKDIKIVSEECQSEIVIDAELD